MSRKTTFPPKSETWRALGLGVKDYCAKNGIGSVVLGLSGGIDSALACAIAAASMGRDKVHGLVMPSPYSSERSVKDAEDLARRLKLPFLDKLPISLAMEAFSKILSPVFASLPSDSA
jgi:NH3-dependent NAD+ synthetase